MAARPKKSTKLLNPPAADAGPIPAPRSLTKKPSTNAPAIYRRALVAHLYRLGQSVPEIVEHLSMDYYVEATPGQVEDDLKALRKQWLKLAALSTDEHIKKQVELLDLLLVDAMMLRERGLVKEAAELTIRVEKRRANLLGLDKARKLEVTAKRGEDMSDEEIEQILRSRGQEAEDPEGGDAE